MDDFLGTSIQYSEAQILKLEEEYAKQQEQAISHLIASGFLDSDYEESLGEFTDSESLTESEEKENDLTEQSDLIESIESNQLLNESSESNDSLSDGYLSRSAASSLSSSPPSLLSLSTVDEPIQPNNFEKSTMECIECTEYMENNTKIETNNKLALILASDISAVDVNSLSNSEIRNDNAYEQRFDEKEAGQQYFVEEDYASMDDEDDYRECNCEETVDIIRKLFSTDLRIIILLMLAMIIPELMHDINDNDEQQQRLRDHGSSSEFYYEEDGQLKQFCQQIGFHVRYCSASDSTTSPNEQQGQTELTEENEERECDLENEAGNNDNELYDIHSDSNDHFEHPSFKKLFSIQFNIFDINDEENVNENKNKNEKDKQKCRQQQSQRPTRKRIRKQTKVKFVDFDRFFFDKHTNRPITNGVVEKLIFSQIRQIVDIPRSSMHIGKETMIDPVGTQERRVMTWSSVILSLFSCLYAANTLSLPLPM